MGVYARVDHVWVNAVDNANIYTWWSSVAFTISFGNSSPTPQNNVQGFNIISNFVDMFVPGSMKVVYNGYGWNSRYSVSEKTLVGHMKSLPFGQGGVFTISGVVKSVCPRGGKFAILTAIDVDPINNGWGLWNLMGMIDFASKVYYTDSIDKIVKIVSNPLMINGAYVTISWEPLQQDVYFKNKFGNIGRRNDTDNVGVMTGSCSS
jgi:hypothetical protein